ncbi:FG-GAP-like repeat-containing protein [Streptomyces sp. NPDC058249]|uniref:FG-GAP-like repeat-containing protein n=1 Tax=Streptomyces sp. NPDC058249 TaxID=3346403 RepID=UPI0036ECFB94
MSHRRTFLSRRGPFVIGAGIALAAGALTVPVVHAATVPGTAAAAPSAKRLHDDFNGDGYPDLAIGAPYSKVGGLPTAGAVSVVYGSSSGLSTSRKQVLTWPGRDTSDTPATGYGSGLQSADLDGDGYADLLSSVGVARWTSTTVVPWSSTGAAPRAFRPYRRRSPGARRASGTGSSPSGTSTATSTPTW